MTTKKYKKPEIDKKLCIGCSVCTFNAPKGFELKEDEGFSEVKKGAEKLADDELLSVAQFCPVSAIILYDCDNKQIYPEK
jgi:ferredoxin